MIFRILMAVIPFLRYLVKVKKEEIQLSSHRFDVFKFFRFIIILILFYGLISMIGLYIKLGYSYVRLEEEYNNCVNEQEVIQEKK